MSKRDQVIARIRGQLRDSLFLDPPSTETDLVEGGMIDSLGFMDLFIILEDEFGIEIEPGDLDLDHFRTVERMASFVIDKRNEEVD
jgi:acyl carrier protein